MLLTPKLQGMMYLFLAQIMVAMNIVVSKLLMGTLPVVVMMTIRFGLAAIILLPLHWLTPARHVSWRAQTAALTRRDWIFLVAQAMSAGILFNSLMLTGLQYTDANIAGIITSALPAVIALLSWSVLKEKISAKKSLCVFLATAGLVIIASGKFSTNKGQHSVMGDSLILLSLLPEAGYYVLTKVHPTRLPLFLTSALLNSINALLLLPIAFSCAWDPSSLSVNHWLILTILGVSAGLFYVFWMLGSERVDSVMGSLSTAIMPVTTVIFAWLLLGEGLNYRQFIGLSFVIISIAVYARR